MADEKKALKETKSDEATSSANKLDASTAQYDLASVVDSEEDDDWLPTIPAEGNIFMLRDIRSGLVLKLANGSVVLAHADSHDGAATWACVKSGKFLLS
jgi:hypothetical protein